ncbi:hypothetical protein [Ammoniphilus sp. CFH 90114]|uniref:hypothetical protein n=1 Tax=Ammoniphilus sp. CFH 90114 TaxID=2493665 RepID=UPI00100F869D|nr:hypothetical protein [Ammoniphilus sp. CFH 90114]RXT02317.1 hypothetical protein EIZ39_24975 [Ammoniphilus sp. CFH 90114]
MRTKIIAWLLLVLAIPSVAAYGQVDISKLRVDTTEVGSVRGLFEQSSLIVHGSLTSADEQYPTGQSVNNYKVINYVQSVQVRKYIKGSATSTIRLLTTGTDRLPPPPDPLNKMYPGPLAEGEYILFLQKLSGTNLYTVIGGWQGVYPLMGGKTISLQESGFSDLKGLTVEQMEQKVKQVQ